MQKEWWEHPKASEGWLDDGAGPEAAGTVPSCPGTWSGSAWSCHRAEATVPRCGWETSTALGTSSRACQSTKHVQEHQVMPRAWGCWEVPQELILCASAPLPCAKATQLPQEPRLEQQRERWSLQGRGELPTSPRAAAMSHAPSCLTGPCRAGKNQAQNVSQGEGKGRNKRKFLVDVFPWPSPGWLLQLSTAQHLFAPHLQGTRGAARDPPLAGDTRVVWSDWESLGVKGQLAQLGCWSTGTAAPAASFPVPREEPLCR